METQLSNLYQIPHYKAKKECTSVVHDIGCREFAHDYTAPFILGKGVSQMIQKQKAGPLGYQHFLAYTHFSNLDVSGTHSRTCPSFSNEDSPRCLRILCCKWGLVVNFYASVWPSLHWGTHRSGEFSHRTPPLKPVVSVDKREDLSHTPTSVTSARLARQIGWCTRWSKPQKTIQE